MSNFSEKLVHLISSRAEIINNLSRPASAEGDDLDRITGQKKTKGLSYDVPGPNHPSWPDEKAAAYSVILPPLETFMEVPEQIRKEQFFSSFKFGDILVGYISAFQDSGLVITVIACDSGPRRDFDGLKLTGFCPIRQIQRNNNHGNPMDAFQIDDKVRCYILDIIKPGRLILSMNAKHSNKEIYGDTKFGPISDDEIPLHYKKLLNLDNKSFEECLATTPQFQNPDGIVVLSKRFGIPRSSTCSLLFSYSSMKIESSEMGVELRRAQLRGLSMKKVQSGVKFFKERKNTEALQCYNFAIEIENTNPDAYVARGALYASTGAYDKAIEDLDKALSFKPNHANAKNYMGQTLIAYANEIQPKDPKKAVEMVKKAIKVNRKNNEGRDLLKELTGTSCLSDEDEDTQIESNRRELNARAWSGNSDGSPGTKKHRPGLQSPDMLRDGRKAHRQSDRKLPSRIRDSPNRMDESPIDRSNESIDDKRGDYSKLVITKDRSGRTIKCADSNGRLNDFTENDRKNNQKGNTRRIFTPPKDVQVNQDGTLTKYQNINDLPSSSKVLHERVQAKLAAIEKRHRGEAGSDHEDHYSDDAGHFNQPRANIWAPPSQYDYKRSRGGDRFVGGRGGRDNFRHNNQRDFRQRPYNNNNQGRPWGPGGDDRRRGGGGGAFGNRRGGGRQFMRHRSGDRRSMSRSRSRSASISPQHNNTSGDARKRPNDRFRRDSKLDKKRSRKSNHRGRNDHSRSSSSRSSSNASGAGGGPGGHHGSPRKSRLGKSRNTGAGGITRAVLETPDLPSLAKVDRIARDDSNAMDEVNNFVAQLKAKRAALIDNGIIPGDPSDNLDGKAETNSKPSNNGGDDNESESESESSSSEEETEGEENGEE